MDRATMFCKTVIDLLVYYKNGNGASLKNLIEKAKIHAQWEPTNSKYWYANLRLALELGGFIEVVETGSSQRWSAVCAQPSFFDGRNTQVLGSEANFAQEMANNQVISRITTEDGLRVFAKAIPQSFRESRQASIALDELILRAFPRSSDVEFDVANLVLGGPPISVGRWEQFNFEFKNWMELKGDDDPKPGLFRSWDPRSGLTIWAYDKSGYSNRIFYPEWTFLLSSRKLGFDWASLLTLNRDIVEVPRQVRLPRLLLKTLFAKSKCVKISWKIEFEGIEPDTFRSIQNMLKDKGY